MKDAACLRIVHVLQHPTSGPTSQSTQHMMVNAMKTNFSRLPAGKFGKSTKRWTRQCHQANEGKSGLEAERVRALSALCTLRCKTKFVAVKRQQTNIFNNEEKEKSIKHYMER
jgi:hypothetical protein